MIVRLNIKLVSHINFNNYQNIITRLMTKLYEAWPGYNRFCCGRITGPAGDICANICVYTCVMGALIPYSIIMVDTIWNVSPAIVILFYASLAILVLFLALTSYTDPGIIPRRPFLEGEY